VNTSSLNPLAISHIARNTSFNIIGRKRKINIARLKPIISNKFPTNNIMTAITPQTDINRGISFD
jgi:hypothetical protein